MKRFPASDNQELMEEEEQQQQQQRRACVPRLVPGWLVHGVEPTQGAWPDHPTAALCAQLPGFGGLVVVPSPRKPEWGVNRCADAWMLAHERANPLLYVRRYRRSVTFATEKKSSTPSCPEGAGEAKHSSPHELHKDTVSDETETATATAPARG